MSAALTGIVSRPSRIVTSSRRIPGSRAPGLTPARSATAPGACPRSFDAFPTVVIREPLRIGPEVHAAIRMDARGGPTRGQTELMDADRHAAGVAERHLDVRRDDHGCAREPHRPDADVVAERGELVLGGGHPGMGIAAPDAPQTPRLLADPHARVLRAADPDPDDGRLAREPALAVLHQRVDDEALDPADAVR